MGILEQLETPNFKATKSDKQLIEYIKKNINEVSYKSISEIAKKSLIGEATITRFARKMGFSGFQEFKVTLAKEISTKDRRSIINDSVKNDESAKDTALKLLQCNVNMLDKTLAITNFNDIHKCAELIKQANKIYFFGLGYSGIVAQDSNYKFMRIGLHCNSFHDGHTMIIMSSIVNKGDVIIAISHSGETEEVINAIGLAKESGAKIISITKNEESRLKSISDINLPYISTETIFETGAVPSKLAQIFLIDLIYTQVVKDMATEAIERKVKTTEAIKKLKNIL
ncbi:MurR/RpiR family transcriptional regulator [Clostridium tarantellae]|uniref:SIS domain-containing protein n=1 Tax=Clostridium tarantellae TaxID=39493 RepID=A0A6I1MIZ0_9CLOT|nr:MurR/RpiR family transcriptional regulator [Clostridium tarantellae]MPQ42663.1 SIS domain-containing protein [Clostridium tarantellae]